MEIAESMRARQGKQRERGRDKEKEREKERERERERARPHADAGRFLRITNCQIFSLPLHTSVQCLLSVSPCWLCIPLLAPENSPTSMLQKTCSLEALSQAMFLSKPLARDRLGEGGQVDNPRQFPGCPFLSFFIHCALPIETENDQRPLNLSSTRLEERLIQDLTTAAHVYFRAMPIRFSNTGFLFALRLV